MREANNWFGRTSFLSIIIIFLLLVLLCSLGAAQDIETKVDEYINAHIKLRNFSGSILIAEHGKILISKGFGMANIEHGVLNSPKTKFRLGSVTKQFTAMLIMQMQERGLLSVGDKLAKFIPDYPQGDKITIHHLLTHTSGIFNITDLSELEDIKTLRSPIEKTIELFKNKPLDFPPGEKSKYSNSGYVLLGFIIEKVSGMPYSEHLQENIFDPLGMKDSGYDSHRVIIKNRAAGYAPGENGPENADYIDMSIPHGGGALYSTIEDMYRWDRALYTEKLITQESLDKIFTPFKNNYGYGWRLSKLFGRKCVGHSGGIEGFTARISRYPEENVCIIVLSNFSHARVNDISKDLAAILFREKYEIPKKQKVAKVDPSIYEAYVGVYEFEPNNTLNISQKNDHLFVSPPGQPKLEIYPKSEIKFYLEAFDAEITFIKNENGEVTKLIFHIGGKDMAAKKIL